MEKFIELELTLMNGEYYICDRSFSVMRSTITGRMNIIFCMMLVR